MAQNELQSLLTAFHPSPAIQSLVADEWPAKKRRRQPRPLLLGVIDRSGLQQLPERWVASLVELLDVARRSLIRAGRAGRAACGEFARTNRTACRGAAKDRGEQIVPRCNAAGSIGCDSRREQRHSRRVLRLRSTISCPRVIGRPNAAPHSMRLPARNSREINCFRSSVAIGRSAPSNVDRLLEAFQQSPTNKSDWRSRASWVTTKCSRACGST